MTCISFITSYGFSRARYVYSLISGVGIFLLGAGVTVYHGVISLLYPPALAHIPAVSKVTNLTCQVWVLLPGVHFVHVMYLNMSAVVFLLAYYTVWYYGKHFHNYLISI